jgi:hypothetical protein
MTPRPLSEIPAKFHAQILAQLAPKTLVGRIPDTEFKPDAQLLPLGANQDEGGGSGRITVVGTKLLDADNLAGSVKFVLDACRYLNLIRDDSPDAISLEVRQRKAHKEETGTLIEIIPL